MSTIVSDDGLARCSWGDSPEIYRAYHDTEWGFPTIGDDTVNADRRLFEKLALEGFQSGLSWLTILRKRENFRAAFDRFDFTVVANYGDDEVSRLLGDAGIVRHRGKIEAVINNAGAAMEMVAAEGSLAAFFWAFEPEEEWDGASFRADSPESRAVAKELKRRGWRFVGPTTIYSFMQAMGLVNDHHPDCHTRAAVAAARQAFIRPAGTR